MSLEDLLDLATVDHPSVTDFFTDQRVSGHWLQLQISRDLANADVRQQMDGNDGPATFRDGSPKFALVIPVNVLGSSDGPQGQALLRLKGVIKDAFASAMSAAGIERPSMALTRGRLGGTQLVITSAGVRASLRPGYVGTRLFDFTYTPNGRELDDRALGRVHGSAR